MGRISASLSGFELRLVNAMRDAEAAIAVNTLRLSTGEKINDPKDDPSGFLTLSGYQQQLANVQTVSANVTAANTIVSGAQLTLDQVRTQLNTIRTTLLEDVGQTLSDSDRAAKQLEIDDALDAIGDLAATQIDGERLLDGSADFRVSGKSGSQVAELRVFSLGAEDQISGSVTEAATQATLTHDAGGATIAQDANFTLTGQRGQATIDVEASEALTLAQFAERVNDQSHATGVTASVYGTEIVFNSADYGTDAEVTVALNSGTFTTGTDAGTDAVATINGQSVSGDGNRFTVVNSGTHARIEFQSGFVGTFSTITIDGGGKQFALTTDVGRTSTFAVAGVQAARLGGTSGTLNQIASGGAAGDLGANTAQAIRIVDEALADLTIIEGGVDGFANASIAAASALMTEMETNLTDAIDEINEVDDAAESLLLARNQALANNAAASLSILEAEESRMVVLLQQIAGLI